MLPCFLQYVSVLLLNDGWADIRRLATSGYHQILKTPEVNKGEKRSPQESKKQKKPQKKGSETSQPNYIAIAFVILVVGLGILFAYTSASLSYANAAGDNIRMNPDWRESLEWMGNNTPETGVNYTTIYNPETFQYPPEAYGVMSWWDYGHMITYIAKRIPNANPFQAGCCWPNRICKLFHVNIRRRGKSGP